MRIWRFHETGSITNLICEEADIPKPAPGQVLIVLKCAALNPADRYLVQGQYPRAGTPPFTPGRDGSGIIVDTNMTSNFKLGDHVCILGGLTGISEQGTLAEYCIVPEEWVVPIPSGWSFAEACAAPLVHLTAWRALVTCGNISSQDTVLITGASGGVGTASVFLAKALGAKVIALSRDKLKRKTLEEIGADVTLDAYAPEIEKDIKKASRESSVSLVIENLGGIFLEKSIRIVSSHGRIMVVGLLDSMTAEVSIPLLIHKNIRVQGLSVSAYTATEARDAWKSILECFDRSGKRPIISKVFSMDAVQEAFQHMHEGPMGKVIIQVSEH